jgi:hypothetical protein
MNLLLHSPQCDRDEEELLHATSYHSVNIVRTPEELRSKLNNAPGEAVATIVILLISKMKDLEKLIASRDCLADKELILILPEVDGEILAQANRLRARYIGFRGGNYVDVSEVLARIQARMIH